MNTYYKTLLLLVGILFLFSCNNRFASNGKAIVTGKYTDSLLDKQSNVYAIITLSVPNVVLGTSIDYKKNVDLDGTFSMEIPIVSPAYAKVSVVSDEYDGLILLSPNKTTRFEIRMDKDGKLNLKVIDGVEIKPEVLSNIESCSVKTMAAAVDGRNSPKIQLPITPKAYADSMLIRMKKDLAIIYEDSILPENDKKLLYDLQKQFYLNALFDYEGDMERRLALRRDMADTISIQKPDKSYYAFLQYFDLNNPPQLNDTYYSANMQTILCQPELNIPPIGDKPIADWLKEAKAILSELTGINSGLFYDILAAEAYIIQLKNSLNPLSETQKENIRTYYSNTSFTDILFSQNKETILQLSEIEKNKQMNLVINETPAVNNKNLIEAIVSQYKGKNVVVDFWTTWCGPCMEAMKELKPLKEELLNKNIVFVYITDTSSPKKLWEKKIQNIGGYQYYLTKEESESISKSKKYGFDGIPTYLFFDSTGAFKNKIIGYPGNEKMRALIEGLLP